MLLRGLLYFIANAAAVFGLSQIFPAFTVESWESALVFIFVLTLFNWTITPVLKILTLPITLITLGLFNFVINTLIVWFTIDILEGIDISGGTGSKLLISCILVLVLGIITQLIEGDKKQKN